MKTEKITTYRIELSESEVEKIIDSIDEISITTNIPDWAKNDLYKLLGELKRAISTQ